jgi:Hypothetical protein (DUF2513)
VDDPVSSARFIIALDPNGRVMVQRDMELVRRILLQVEERKDLRPRLIEIEDVDPIVLGRHVEMLYKAGFLDGPRPITNISSGLKHILVRDLSWDGHEFTGALKTEGVWGKIKEQFSPEKLASLPLEAIKAVAIGFSVELAKQQAGLSG